MAYSILIKFLELIIFQQSYMENLDTFSFDHYVASAKKAIPERILACLFDYGVMIGGFIWFVSYFGVKTEDGSYQVQGAMGSVPLIWSVLYFFIFEWKFAGTPGKKLMGVKLISMDGNRPTLGQVIKRRMCDCVDIWIFCALIGFVLIKNTQYSQRLGDIFAKTLVVKKNNSSF
jgi:uncharacterized RDD family membrane protein YckC